MYLHVTLVAFDDSRPEIASVASGRVLVCVRLRGAGSDCSSSCVRSFSVTVYQKRDSDCLA